MNQIEKLKEFLKEDWEELNPGEFNRLGYEDNRLYLLEDGRKELYFKPKDKYPKVFGDFEVTSNGDICIQSPQHFYWVDDSIKGENLEKAIEESKRIKTKE